MGVYIKGINAPKDCDSCDIVKDCPLWYCTDVGARHPECPITEVKEPHGDLVDSKYIIDQLYKVDFDTYYVYSCAFDIIDKAPTVIERSE